MEISVKIDGNDITSHVALPIKWNELLDERLDEGRLSVRAVSVDIYPIGARVEIIISGTVYDFIVSADESTEQPVGSRQYDHELSLIEPTKELEGITVANLTFTNSQAHNYEDEYIEVAPQYV